MILAYIIFFTFVGSIVSLIGSFFLLVKKRLSETFSDQILNFAAGVLIAVAFLDLLPEAAEASNTTKIFLPALFGFITFFMAERFIQWFHRHHEHGQKSSIWLILVGDGVHNFIDGVAIAASFLTNINLGIVTSFAVAAHEIPQEIADLGILITGGLTKPRALFYNFLSATTALAGAIIAFLFSSMITQNLYIFLSITAGFFIYIAASDLIPQLHEKYIENKKFSHTFIFISGILIVYFFTKIFEG